MSRTDASYAAEQKAIKLENTLRDRRWTILTQESFSKEVGPYLGFTRNQLLDMLAEADDNDEGLPIVTDRENYFLPPEGVKEFFKINQKPERKLPPKEENVLLKKRLQAMEEEIKRLRGLNVEPPKKVFTYPEGIDRPRIVPVDLGTPPPILVEEDQPLEFPETKPKPMTPDEMRQMLKEEEDEKRRKRK